MALDIEFWNGKVLFQVYLDLILLEDVLSMLKASQFYFYLLHSDRSTGSFNNLSPTIFVCLNVLICNCIAIPT